MEMKWNDEKSINRIQVKDGEYISRQKKKLGEKMVSSNAD
jgi:hypothetical protein